MPTQSHTHTRTRSHTCARTPRFLHLFISACVCVRVNIYTYVYIHTYLCHARLAGSWLGLQVPTNSYSSQSRWLPWCPRRQLRCGLQRSRNQSSTCRCSGCRPSQRTLKKKTQADDNDEEEEESEEEEEERRRSDINIFECKAV